jgi:Adenosylmethionine-8-amino-7-oxononanoate aminotransferase
LSGPDREPTRAELVAWDDAHVWHPFTPHSVYRADDPLMVVAGEGHYLVDADGSRYLDAVASLWCNLFGHRRQEIDAAIRAQLERIAHSTFLGNASVPAVRLARRLVGLAPAGLTRVFFSDDGSTAVEVAAKMAYQYWQQADAGRGRARTAFLTLGNAYHGDTIGSVSLGGIDLFHQRYRPLLFPTIQAPSPYTYRPPAGHDAASYAEWCIAELERLVRANAERLAAVVLEPGIQGAAGMIVQPEGFVRRVREVTRETGTLLILDEVATGFGRSGRMFARTARAWRRTSCASPRGSRVATSRWPRRSPLSASSARSSDLPPRVARSFTDIPTPATSSRRPPRMPRSTSSRAMGSWSGCPRQSSGCARRWAGSRGWPRWGEIRQYGLAAGVELVADRATRAPFPAGERRGMRVCRAARRHGVFLRPLGDVVVVMPPLTITPGELDRIAAALGAAIPEACA